MRVRVLGACALSLLACSGSEGRSESADPVQGVAQLLASSRPFLPRLGGSLAHQGCTPPGESSPHLAFVCTQPIGRAQLSQAMQLAQDLGHASGRDAWASALLDLATSSGNATSVDGAISRLEGLVDADSTPALMLNDLAVAYLVRASANHSAEDVFRAMELFERLGRAPDVPEVVRFNHALVLDRAGLLQEARRAWREFIANSQDPEWIAEARGYLAILEALPAVRESSEGALPAPTLQAAAVEADPQRAREYVIDELLPRWMAAHGKGDAKTAVAIHDSAQELSRLVVEASGDSSAALATQQLKFLSESRPTVAAAGVATIVRGSEHAALGHLSPAGVTLDSAFRTLGGAVPAFTGWSEGLRSFVDLDQGDWRAAEARWERVADYAVEHGATSLAARARWGQALSMARRWELSGAEQAYSAANELYLRARESANRGRVLTQLADVVTRLGRDAEGMSAVLEAMFLLREGRSPRGRHDALIALGELLQEVELPYAATAVYRDAVANAPRSTRGVDPVEAWIHLARAEAEVADRQAATAAMRRADSLARALPPEDMTERMRADLARTAAGLADRNSAQQALRRLDTVITHFVSMKNKYVQTEVLLQRSRLALLRGDSGSALVDLTSLQATLGQTGSAVERLDDRRRQVAAQRKLLDELLKMRLAQHDTLEALRTYALLVGASPGDAIRLLHTRVPDGVTFAAYAVLTSEIVLWVKHGSDLTIHHLPVPAQRVAWLVEHYVRAVRSGFAAGVADTSGKELAQVALGTLLQRVDKGDELVILPDGVLLELPLAALPVDGQYLVEQHAIRYATSLAAALRPGPRLEQRVRGVMVAGRPAHNERLFRGLADLPYAEPEAQAVAHMYAGSSLAIGDDATRAWVVSRLPSVSLFHFAGHARISASSAQRSHLVLSSTSDEMGDNVLYAEDIAQLDLKRLALAVLSACGTTTRMSRRVPATQSLSRAFLDAGAQAVVSSLWEADDSATQLFMAAMYRALAGGATVAAALHAAQLEAIVAERRGSGSSQWAAFRLDTR